MCSTNMCFLGILVIPNPVGPLATRVEGVGHETPISIYIAHPVGKANDTMVTCAVFERVNSVYILKKKKKKCMNAPARKTVY